MYFVVVIIGAVVAVGFGVYSLLRRPKYKDSVKDVSSSPEKSKGVKVAAPKKKRNPVTAKRGGAPVQDLNTAIASHELLVETLKATTGKITCVAVDNEGTKLAVGFMDSSIRVTWVELESKSKPIPSPAVTHRVVLEGGDIPTNMSFSADGSSLYCALEYRRNFVKLQLDADSSGKRLQERSRTPDEMHKTPVRFFCASKGDWILSSGDGGDTQLKVWSTSGNLLATCDTKQIRNYQVNISPHTGKFFAAASWTAGVKLWNVVTSRDGQYQKTVRAMDLKSSCGTYAVAFSADDTTAVVVQKDGTLLLWRIDVRYEVSEDAKVIRQAKLPDDPSLGTVSFAGISNDGKHVVVASERNLRIFTTSELKLIHTVMKAHRDFIDNLVVPAVGNYFLTYASEDKVRIWRFPS
eukprot:Lankesteria_metandrocarpae@DN5180_c0_g1_i1.p1